MSSTFRALTSITNPVVKELVRLRESRRFRRTARSTLVSGARVLEEIVKQSATTPLRRLLVTDAALASPALSAAAGEVFIVTKEIMRKISNQTHTPDVLAELAWPSSFVEIGSASSEASTDANSPTSDTQGLEELSKHRFILALSSVNDPGNLGTLLRTAAALNWDCVCLIRQSTPPAVDSSAEPVEGDEAEQANNQVFQTNCVDAMNPKAVAAARGSQWHLPLYAGVTWQQLRSLKNRAIVLADAHGGSAPAEVASALKKRGDKREKHEAGVVLVMGSEAHGIPPAELTAADSSKTDLRVSIPVRQSVDSLNVAAAGALLMCSLREAVLGPKAAAVGLSMQAPAANVAAVAGQHFRSRSQTGGIASSVPFSNATSQDVDEDPEEDAEDARVFASLSKKYDEVEEIDFRHTAQSVEPPKPSKSDLNQFKSTGKSGQAGDRKSAKPAPKESTLDEGNIFDVDDEADSADVNAQQKRQDRQPDWKSRLVSARSKPKRFSRNTEDEIVPPLPRSTFKRSAEEDSRDSQRVTFSPGRSRSVDADAALRGRSNYERPPPRSYATRTERSGDEGNRDSSQREKYSSRERSRSADADAPPRGRSAYARPSSQSYTSTSRTERSGEGDRRDSQREQFSPRSRSAESDAAPRRPKYERPAQSYAIPTESRYPNANSRTDERSSRPTRRR